MQYNEIFSAVNNQLTMDDLTPVTADNYAPFSGSDMTYNEVVEYLRANGLDPAKLYMLKTDVDALNEFWYIDEPEYLGIPGFPKDNEFLSMLGLTESGIGRIKAALTELWEKKEYIGFFYHFGQPFSLYYFRKRLREIDTDKLFDLFVYLYTSSNYGFSILSKEDYRYVVLQFAPKDFTLPLNKDGLVDVWRGEGEKSSSYEESLSWTLDINVALMFATRFQDDGRVLHAAVPRSAVQAYMHETSEQEVLIFPEDIKSVERLDFLTITKVFDQVQARSSIIDEYQFYRTNFVKKDLFTNPEGAHDALHTARVLFLSLLIAFYEKFDMEERTALAYCALYHDIGRTHDGCDTLHGAESVKKANSRGFFKKFAACTYLDSKWHPVADAVIRNHCVDDKEGLSDIMADASVADKETAVKLYKAFKDADALDRVRLRDLDIRYLRTKSAKRLPLVAHQVFKGIK